MDQFISGVLTSSYAVAGLFFLRFWARTRDRLFALFALAFWILSAQRAMIGFRTAADEDLTLLYLLRFAAFVLILIAIIDKNRGQSESGPDRPSTPH